MSIDPAAFKAPYIPAQQCWDLADQFREELWPSGDYPVDVLAIAEFSLGLEMCVVDGLKASQDVDALLGLDFQTIAVDRDQYMESRFHARMRYSVAHELGHYVLHKKVADAFPKEEKEFLEFYSQIPEDQYSWIEYQANEFAGALLVPMSELSHRLGLYLEKVRASDLSDEGVRVQGIAWLAKYFAVSTDVVEKRLTRGRMIP
jgi:hypothetical protein